MLAAEYPDGMDVIYEGVGGAMQRAAYASLAPGGRMLVVGYISGGCWAKCWLQWLCCG